MEYFEGRYASYYCGLWWVGFDEGCSYEGGGVDIFGYNDYFYIMINEKMSINSEVVLCSFIVNRIILYVKDFKYILIGRYTA